MYNQKTQIEKSLQPIVNENNKERGRLYRSHNKEKELERHRIYNEKNRELIAQRNKEQRLAKLDEIKAKKKDYYQKNKEHIKAKTKEWKQVNREYDLERKKAWYAENRDKLHEYDRSRRPTKRIRERERGATDPQYILRKRLHSRIVTALRSKGTRKMFKTSDLMGCTLVELRAHIEKQFKPGMTWANKGEWEVDHIRPCAAFDLRDVEQQKICFHFSNLRPLWKAENRAKSARILPVEELEMRAA